jgi:HSP20 family protein
MKNPLALFQQRNGLRVPSFLKAFAEMESEMDRMMQASMKWPEEVETLVFSPTCNFKENEKEYIMQFDIPGVKKEEVKIEMQNNRVTVSGERKEKKEEKDAKHFLSEAYYGSFLRSFTLPAEVDENKVDANYEDGVLTIKVPKLAITKAKEVKIH